MSKDNNKTCFIMMPIGEVDTYNSSHFQRVYEHLIKPAVEKAGFKPIRADKIKKTNYIMIDIIKKLIDSDMAICDISSKNPNVLYELGIRHSFNLPVVILKDKKTNRMFDIQGIRDVEYDGNLRIDLVNEKILELKDVIKNTYNEMKKEDGVNSIIQLLGINSANINSTTELTGETSLLLQAIEDIKDHLIKIEDRKINDKNDDIYYYDKIYDLGDIIEHPKWGEGKIVDIKGKEITIKFKKGSSRTLLAPYAPIKKKNISDKDKDISSSE